MKTLVLTIIAPDDVLDVTLEYFANGVQEEARDDAAWTGEPPWLVQHTIRPATEKEAEALNALLEE